MARFDQTPIYIRQKKDFAHELTKPCSLGSVKGWLGRCRAATQRLRGERGARLIRAVLEHFGADRATLRRAREGDWRKVLLAVIQRATTMRLDWITGQLNMGTRAGTLPPCR